jgi:hypothetical protein
VNRRPSDSVTIRGIPRDPQLGSSSIQTPTLGWPSSEIVVNNG